MKNEAIRLELKIVIFTAIAVIFFGGCSVQPDETPKRETSVKPKISGRTRVKPPLKETLKFPSRIIAKEIRIPILMYHRTGELLPNSNAVAKDLTVKPESFIEQMELLDSKGYSTVKFSDLFEALYWRKPLPKKPVIITFDDGYEDNYSVAFPALKKRGMKGVFFVITERIASKFHMTWTQLKEMESSGMEIGSHTNNHVDLRSLQTENPALASKEIASSRQELEERLGKRVYSFCYPFGRYEEKTVKMVRKAGYLFAVTTHYGKRIKSSSPFELPRVRIRRTTTLREFENLVK